MGCLLHNSEDLLSSFFSLFLQASEAFVSLGFGTAADPRVPSVIL